MRQVLVMLLPWWVACSGASADGVSGAAGAPAAVPVQVAAARDGALQDAWRLAADVRALDRATLAPQVAGQVVEVAVREGDRVTRGESLLRVDPDLAMADRAAAAADVTAAQAEAQRTSAALARLEGLAEGVVSDRDRDDAIAARDAAAARLAQAEAALDRATEVLARHTLRAPFTCAVAARRVDPGDHVAVGQAVLELVGTEGVDILVDGPAGLLSTLAPGESAEIVGPDGATATARLAGLVPALDPVARTVRVRLVPEEVPAWMLPGASVSARLRFDRSATDAVVLPRDALLEGAGGVAVLRVGPDGTAERVDVVVLARNDSEVLARGIAVGDRVVTRGNERLRPGQAVVVREPDAP